MMNGWKRKRQVKRTYLLLPILIVASIIGMNTNVYADMEIMGTERFSIEGTGYHADLSERSVLGNSCILISTVENDLDSEITYSIFLRSVNGIPIGEEQRVVVGPGYHGEIRMAFLIPDGLVTAENAEGITADLTLMMAQKDSSGRYTLLEDPAKYTISLVAEDFSLEEKTYIVSEYETDSYTRRSNDAEKHFRPVLEEPSRMSTVIAEIAVGSRVISIGQSEEKWLEILTDDGQIGWIPRQYVEAASDGVENAETAEQKGAGDAPDEQAEAADSDVSLEGGLTPKGEDSTWADISHTGENAGVQQETETDNNKLLIQYTVTASTLNIRANSNASAERIGQLSRGSLCTGTGNFSDDGEWIEVYIDESLGITGWGSAKYLQQTGEVSVPDAEIDGQTHSYVNQAANEQYQEEIEIPSADASSDPASDTLKNTSEYMGMKITAYILDNRTVVLTFDNDTGTEFSIGGWSRPQEACLTTSSGEFWTSFNSFMGITIKAHSTETIVLTFGESEGEAESILIHEICSLVDGLPTFGQRGDVRIPLS